jgi:hypothetical protein
MPAKRNMLDPLCEAIRALPPVAGAQALNELYTARVITLNETIECGRALTTLRAMVQKRDDKEAISNGDD